jgi:hypothetical protein
MLPVDPRQRPRLVETIANLTERIEEAELNGWLGEKEGLGVSLQAARAKLATLDRHQAQSTHPTTDLGIPEITTAR